MLILAREDLVAALLGLMVEVAGFEPKFAGRDEPVADAIAEERPQAVLIDCDHPDLDEGLVGLLRNSSARPILFSAFRKPGEVSRLATRYGTESFTLPVESATFTQILRR